MECDVPAGWNHWGGFTCTNYKGNPLGGTYNYYNSSQWQVDFDDEGNCLTDMTGADDDEYGPLPSR